MKGQYVEQKKAEQRDAISKVSMQRNFEDDLHKKKEAILQQTKDIAKTRYENQIKEEETRATVYTNTIVRLEQREKEMINKLKNTQNAHAAFVEDLERINQNQEPNGPLSNLREGLNGSGRKKFLNSPNPKPKITTPKKELVKSPLNKSDSSQKKQQTNHQLYAVNDFYR